MIYEDKKILLEVVYGPNIDSPDFYSDQVFKQIIQWEPDYSIFCGDFNLILDPSMDSKNYLNINNPNARQMVLDQMETHNLIDIWRELHPEEKKFTWRKFNENKQGRLDFFLISSSGLIPLASLHRNVSLSEVGVSATDKTFLPIINQK